MLLNLLLVILILGLNVALLARYPRLELADRGKVVSSVFSLMLLTNIGFEFLFFFLMLFLGKDVIPSVNMKMVVLICCISFLESIWLMFATLFRAEGAAWTYISASLAQVLSSLLSTIMLITVYGFREDGILFGRLTGDIILMLIISPNFVRYRPRFDLQPALELLKIGVPMVPAALSNIWLLMSPRYFVEKYCTTAEVGIFAMSTKIAGIVSLIFIQPFALAWMVVLFKIILYEDAKRMYERVVTYYFLTGGVVALSLGVAAPKIVVWLGKVNFPISSSVITIMSLAYIASGIMYPVTIGPYIKEKTHRMVPVFVLSAILSLIVGSFTTWRWGIIGAALSLLVVYTFQAYLLHRVSNTLYRINIEWRRLFKIIVGIGIAYFVTMAIEAEFNGIMSLAIPIVFLVITVCILVTIDYFDVSEKQYIKKLAKNYSR
jgi:O-antigen/teichoic acid export membrane protein